jgi:type III pantothenate kinase
MILGLLVGNTRLRYGFFRHREVVESGALEWAAVVAKDSRPLERLLARAAPQEVVVGSVRDDRLEELESALPPGCPPIRVAGRDFSVPVENHYERPSEAGVDRLLNALAARTLWPGCSVIVLDFGTALSVSALSPRGAFLGGLIGVGLGGALATLRSFTPRLPAAEVSPPGRFLGRNTRDALGAGLYWQLAGGAQRILDGLRGELPPPVRVVATGGDAELLASGVDGIDRIDPDLTLRGLLLAALARGTGRLS